MSGRVIAAATISLLLAGMPGLGAAQPATPAATPLPAVACVAPARSEADLAALFATPAAGATPATMRPDGTVPGGTPADAATTAALTATISGWLACQNAGESLRAWSLFTDRYLRHLLDRQGGLGIVTWSSLATPNPAPPDRLARIAGVRDARVLPDGRAGATVTLTYPSVPMPKHFFFVFERVGDTWLIDGILGEISFEVP